MEMIFSLVATVVETGSQVPVDGAVTTETIKEQLIFAIGQKMIYLVILYEQ